MVGAGKTFFSLAWGTFDPRRQLDFGGLDSNRCGSGRTMKDNRDQGGNDLFNHPRPRFGRRPMTGDVAMRSRVGLTIPRVPPKSICRPCGQTDVPNIPGGQTPKKVRGPNTRHGCPGERRNIRPYRRIPAADDRTRPPSTVPRPRRQRGSRSDPNESPVYPLVAPYARDNFQNSGLWPSLTSFNLGVLSISSERL